MQKKNLISFIFIIFFLPLFCLAQEKDSPKPVALFLDCYIGTNYSTAIASTIKARGEELIVVKCKDFDKKIEELAQRKVYVKTLFASGHDGDGKVYSGKGVEYQEFDPVVVLDKVNKKYPQLFNQTQSYYPLGCYTTSPSNLQQYIKVLPGLKFVSGFYGSGHSSHRKISQDYLKEVLQKESEIIEASDIRKFEMITRSLNALKTPLNVGIYRNYACSTQSQKYEDQELKGFELQVDNESIDGKVDRIVNFSKDECKKKINDFEINYEKYLKYENGLIDIPINTQSGELRSLYSFFRQNEYCIDTVHDGSFNKFPYGDNVFSLLFNRNYRKNFKAYYEDVTGKLSLLKTQLKKALKQSKNTDVDIQKAFSQIQDISGQNMSSWTYKQILDMSVSLQGLSVRLSDKVKKAKYCPWQSTSTQVKKTPLDTHCVIDNYNEIANAFTDLLANRNGPTEWHDYSDVDPVVEPYETQ